jgi:hypothetical protein
VKLLSFESNPKDPVAVVNAKAMPLLAIAPLAQDCTSVVISIRTNWFVLAEVIAIGLPPVAETPSGGALL